MSTTVKISNGEVIIKEFVSRKLRKEINKALFDNIKAKTTLEGKLEMEDFKFSDSDKANDLALVGMTEKIVIDGVEKPVTIETFDEMPSKDVDNIIKAINEVKDKEIPNA